MVRDTCPPPRFPPKKEDREPTPLVFPLNNTVNDPTPKPLNFSTGIPAHTSTDPVIAPLSFPNRPKDYTKVEQAKIHTERLQFAKKPERPIAPTHAPEPGKSLFADAKSPSDQSLIKSAIQYVQTNYGDLGETTERIERQIRQILPLKTDVLMGWGATALSENGSNASRCAQAVKEYTELRSNELIEAALKAAQYVPENQSLLEKVFSSKQTNLLYYKPRLVVMQTQLKTALPNIESLLEQSSKLHGRLMLCVASLAAAVQVSGTINDATLDRITQERRTILTQAANQAKLVNLQLTQTKGLIADQLSRLDQMINVTIPAFELANASK